MKGFVFKGEEKTKWADFVTGDEAMTMVVCLSEGRNAIIEPSLKIFKNKDLRYSVCGVADTVAGAAYRTGPRGEWTRK